MNNFIYSLQELQKECGKHLGSLTRADKLQLIEDLSHDLLRQEPEKPNISNTSLSLRSRLSASDKQDLLILLIANTPQQPNKQSA